jgi:fructose-1,6-bisphosphatase
MMCAVNLRRGRKKGIKRNRGLIIGKDFLLKVISLLLIPTFLLSSISIAETRPTKYATIGPYCLTQLVEEVGTDLAKLRDTTRFKSGWVKEYAERLAAKMAKKVGKLKEEGKLSLSLEDAERELIQQIRAQDWSRDANVQKYRRDTLIKAIQREFKALQEAELAEADCVDVEVNNAFVTSPLLADVDHQKIKPETKGFLQEVELEDQRNAIDDVDEEIRKSYREGFLQWPERIIKKFAEISIVAGNFSGKRDIIILGAPAVAEALTKLRGIENDCRLHFINNLEAHRFEEMDKLDGFNWKKTGVVFVSQGAGDSIQQINFDYLIENKNILKTNCLAVAPEDHPVMGQIQLQLTTPDLESCDGVPFCAEAFALSLALAGHNYEELIREIQKEFKGAFAAQKISSTGVGALSAVLRGQSLKQAAKIEHEVLTETPIANLIVAAYSNEAEKIMRALAQLWNTLLGARTQMDTVSLPEGQHHQLQMAFSSLGVGVINVVPTETPDIGVDGIIPPDANGTIASTRNNTFTVNDFMRVHLRTLADTPDKGWVGTTAPVPGITVRYPGIADLISAFHLASLISYKVAVKNGDRQVMQPDTLIAKLKGLDANIQQGRGQAESQTTADSDNPFVMPFADGQASLDVRGLINNGIFGETPKTSNPNFQKVLAACLSSAQLVTSNYWESKGKKHNFFNAPLKAGKGETRNKFDRTRKKSRAIGEGGERIFVLAIGGARNSNLHGSDPLRDFYANETSGKREEYVNTLDPVAIKAMCDEIRENPAGVRLIYVSNTGDTDESDAAYRRALRTLLRAARDKEGLLSEEMKTLSADEDTKSMFVDDAEDFAPILHEVMDKEPVDPVNNVTTEEYVFLKRRVLIVTGQDRGKLSDNQGHVGFIRVSYPPTNGRQSIFELGLIKQAVLGRPDEEIDAYIRGAERYISNLLDVLPKDKKERKAILERRNELINRLEEGEADKDDVQTALELLRRDPGMFAGSLLGLLNRPNYKVKLDIKPKTKLRVIYLSDLLYDDWISCNNFNESLGKPSIQFVACDVPPSNLLNQLASLREEKDSSVLLLVDQKAAGGLSDAQRALVNTANKYFADNKIPHTTLYTSSSSEAHAASIFALQTMAIGIGCQQVTAAGYEQDDNVYGQEYVEQLRRDVREEIDKERGRDIVAGVADVENQWELNPEKEKDRAILDFARMSGKLNSALYPLLRGWDTEYLGQPNKVCDRMLEQVIANARGQNEMFRALILVHPITHEITKVELNPKGKHIGVFVADNPFDSCVLGNTSIGLFSLFELESGKALKKQELSSKNLLVQTTLKFGAFPTSFVNCKRYGRFAVYNYLTTPRGDLEPRVIKGGIHQIDMPKEGAQMTTLCGPINEFPEPLAKYYNDLVASGYKERKLGPALANAVFIAQKGGITGEVQPLLNAFLGYKLLWKEGFRGGKPIYFDKKHHPEQGYYDIPEKITVEEIINGNALRPVLAVAADRNATDALIKAMKAATSGKLKVNEDLLEIEQIEDHPIEPGDTVKDVLTKDLELVPQLEGEAEFKEGVLDTVKELLWISAVVLPFEYLNPQSTKVSGGNPSAESQKQIDEIATALIEKYAEESDMLRWVITEEGAVRDTGRGRLAITTDPVDGIGNLDGGDCTGQFFTLIDAHTGRMLVSLDYSQGSGRLIMGTGHATYAFQYLLDNYQHGTPIDFKSMDQLENGDFHLLFRVFDNTTPESQKRVAHGGTVSSYYKEETEIEEKLTKSGHRPANSGSIICDVIGIEMGAHWGNIIKAYFYPSTTDAKANPDNAEGGGKLRPTEENVQAHTAIGVIRAEFKKTLQDSGKIEKRAKVLAKKLLGIKPEEFSKYPRAQEIMRQLAKDQLVCESGLSAFWGVYKGLGLFNFVSNLDDTKIVPEVGAPIAMGKRDVVEMFQEAAWGHYVKLGLASENQAKLSPEDWTPEKDSEWETYGPHERRARLVKNHAVGAVKLACGLWQPVVARDHFNAEDPNSYINNFARHQEKLYQALMSKTETPIPQWSEAPPSFGLRQLETINTVVENEGPSGEATMIQEVMTVRGVAELAGSLGSKERALSNQAKIALLHLPKPVQSLVRRIQKQMEPGYGGSRVSREEVEKTLDDEKARMPGVASSDIRKQTDEMVKQAALQESEVEKKIAIVMMKDLTTKADTGNDVIDPELRTRYNRMKRELEDRVGEFKEVNDRGELVTAAKSLIGDNYRIIVMDDSTLTEKDLDKDDVSLKNAAGELNYCIISSTPGRIGDDNTSIRFVNLNAMYYMGIGVLYKNARLFKSAYETFTDKDPSDDGIDINDIKNGMLWIIRALPRIVRLIEELKARQYIKAIFDSAA